MTDGRKLQMEFNTALNALDPATGAWDEKAHSDMVMPLRGKLMQIDGVYGCNITRYGMHVQYYPNVVSKTKLIKAIKALVKEISTEEKFFPLKGSKVPSVRPEKAARQDRHITWRQARVDFSTDLYADKGKQHTADMTDELSASLADADGVREHGVWQRGMYVHFDPREARDEDMRAHLEKTVAKIMEDRTGKNYFPFGEPTFSYREYNTPYSI